MSNQIAIYVLRDPQDGSVRYVGQAADPEARLRSHLAECRPNARIVSAKQQWIRSLLSAGCLPILETVERVPEHEATAREAHWIDHFRTAGRICNARRPKGTVRRSVRSGRPVPLHVVLPVDVMNELDRWVQEVRSQAPGASGISRADLIRDLLRKAISERTEAKA